MSDQPSQSITSLLDALVIDIQSALTDPVEAYFRSKNRLYRGPAMLRGVVMAYRDMVARQDLTNALQTALTALYTEAAQLAVGRTALDGLQTRKLNELISSATRYLDGYLADLQNMSLSQALQRIRLYRNAIVQAYSQIASVGKPRLPVYPGDRSLDCHGFCYCHLEWVRVDARTWHVWWIMNAKAEHSPDCIGLAQSWRPLIIRDGLIVAKGLQKVELAHLKMLAYIAYGERL